MTLTIDGPASFIAPPCHDPVEILYADEYCLLINKPSGLLSVPGRLEENRDCAITRVQETYPDALIVHRLDMDTSGIMVIARGKESHRHFSIQFQDRHADKAYVAWVDGIVQDDEGSMAQPMRCDWPNRPKQMVDYELGKSALTLYKVIERDPANHRTLLELKPVTGRSHQLRVHTAAMGHPILGCRFYGTERSIAAAERLQLHASFLSIAHPVYPERLEMHCPPEFT
ncbi:pseudouridine synthase [Parendozoicomonas haliclonae]|uniref:Dual-specificity RNA pseudouridine synthase RluA n=1 Tax=Parendozoicomonas haliclonae TaxID=1960125 RepID=A0A1X7AJZ7_9GAMM|nr:Ribosomal large subunit pseudouridine synthase A [Parendozoicomonas haliclonae]